MTLTKTERALLANQNKILALLDTNNAEYYSLKAEIAENGYTGLYHKLFQGISDEIPEEICKETHDILHMYRVIENAIAPLTDEQKETIPNFARIKFEGFDGNNDPHYFYTKFMVEKENTYRELGDKPLNSHTMASIGKYRSMLPVFQRVTQANHHNLNLDGLKEIGSSI